MKKVKFILPVVLLCFGVLTFHFAHPQVVKATSGTGCIAPCYIPATPPTTCLAGGTTPGGPIQSNTGYTDSAGTQVYAEASANTDCQVVITYLDASLAANPSIGSTSNPVTFVIWIPTGDGCTSTVSSNVLYAHDMTVDTNHPIDHLILDGASGPIVIAAATQSYVCYGFNGAASNAFEKINATYWVR